MSEPWLRPEEMRAWRALLGAQQRLGRILDAELHAHGTSLGDHEVLIVLSEQPDGALRMADLADLLILSRSGLTRRIDRMVTAGLVVRTHCPADGRGVYAQITPTGRRALTAATPVHVAGVHRHFIDVLTPDELHQVAVGLEKVAVHGPGGEQGAPAGPPRPTITPTTDDAPGHPDPDDDHPDGP